MPGPGRLSDPPDRTAPQAIDHNEGRTRTMTEFRLIKSEVKPLSLVLAQAFRDLEGSPTERDLDLHRMKHLREKGEEGKFITFHWAKAMFEGRWIRVNGQHSSALLCELDGGFPTGLFAHIDEYEVDSLTGLT